MTSTLHIDPADPRPLWSQIEESVRRLVASGRLKGGDAMPSVRDLARDLTINPATVSKAYQRLTDAGVLVVRRGEGTFVAEGPPDVSPEERERELHQGAERYAGLALTLGADRRSALERLQDAWKNLLAARRERADAREEPRE